jgi:hypothetical protein
MTVGADFLVRNPRRQDMSSIPGASPISNDLEDIKHKGDPAYDETPRRTTRPLRTSKAKMFRTTMTASRKRSPTSNRRETRRLTVGGPRWSLGVGSCGTG